MRARVAPSPEIGSHPGWPLVLYFHHVRSDLEHYTVLRPAEFSFALDLLSRYFRPMEPECLGESPTAWLGEPTCLLTFDDGYRDVWEQAAPMMEEEGWRAVMFASTGKVGGGEEHPERGALEYMTWSQLRELRDRGHVIGAHGHTHRDMSLMGEEAVRAEIAAARGSLVEELGSAGAPFAYPYGNWPAAAETLASALPSLCFGSVKAPPAPWTDTPWLVRRTFLPSGAVEHWPNLVEEWRRQWERCASL